MAEVLGARDVLEQVDARLGNVEQDLRSLRTEMNGRFDRVYQEIGDLRTEMDARFQEMNGHFQEMDARFQEMNGHFQEMNGRFQEMNGRFNRVYEEIGGLRTEMDARFQEVDARFQEVDARFQEVDARFQEVDARFDRVYQEIGGLRTEIAARVQWTSGFPGCTVCWWPCCSAWSACGSSEPGPASVEDAQGSATSSWPSSARRILMTQTLDATYEGQVLRPDQPVELAPNTRVRIAIETLDSPPRTASFRPTISSPTSMAQLPRPIAEALLDPSYAIALSSQ